ncbi:MAG: cytochrome b/b6 domain-containing protein [Phenylobacterium sp.]|uniref:cytochrome b n=1 Tax=Phenylobacterium sp. TaxID=1871053 RepID=UPI0025E84D49|nr:cytochrome b/b6 domain-containing protein [Phenylobacterium sp.]MCA6227228.1 cytochrome b/b6 domain-containing protein [Phenylobacterium sp.]MCA6230670.1 cytochrome b/b6 domain-containing protein [Phenylobacterium sp.]
MRDGPAHDPAGAEQLPSESRRPQPNRKQTPLWVSPDELQGERRIDEPVGGSSYPSAGLRKPVTEMAVSLKTLTEEANMDVTTPQQHYPSLMRWLHWTIACLIITALICGLLLGYGLVKGDSPAGGVLMSIHVGCAMASLPLWFIRLTLRRRSKLPEGVGPGWQQSIARVSHLLLYVLTLALPMTGYAMDIAYGGAPTVFGFRFPDFGLTAPGVQNEPLGEALWFFHSNAGQGLALVVLLHVLAAIWNTLKDPAGGIRRMLSPPRH